MEPTTMYYAGYGLAILAAIAAIVSLVFVFLQLKDSVKQRQEKRRAEVKQFLVHRGQK